MLGMLRNAACYCLDVTAWMLLRDVTACEVVRVCLSQSTTAGLLGNVLHLPERRIDPPLVLSHNAIRDWLNICFVRQGRVRCQLGSSTVALHNMAATSGLLFALLVSACLTLYFGSYDVKGQEEQCDARYYDYDSFVCVCTEERCDSPGEILPPQDPEVLLSVLTTRDEHRFHVDTAPFHMSRQNPNAIIRINKSQTFQRILGFGAHFPDATGFNLLSLGEPAQRAIMEGYFSERGWKYNLARVPMAGVDSSVRPYTYDDVDNDATLEHFALAPEDYNYKLPFIKEAKELSEGLLVMASPWSAPAWMKTNGAINGTNGGAALKPEHYGLWAQYYLKFLQAYEAEGVQVWGLTPQNEPIFGSLPDFPFNCMGWTPEQQQEFVRDHLGPTLRDAGYGNILIFIFDDQRYYIEEFVTIVMADEAMSEWVSGVAMHWYMNFIPPDVQDTIHEMYPNLMLLMSEASNGVNPWEHHIFLGFWEHGEKYALDIIQNLNHWMVGWLDWNLAVDLLGGPNWAEFYADGPIIVNATAGEYYKNPSYYAMGHFSKFIPRDSLRVGIEVEDGTGSLLLDGTAVLTPEGHIVVVLLNRNETEVAIRLEEGGLAFDTRLPPKSMATLVWVASE
ncbi:unnamed protein product [Darwinula stevensoni]|uniref:Glucosylceramidase n=1 Tax=Darwinula stevensoni TaxID=69355 RepID=A0A7R8X6X1_9CRUS|nr:unnamed protein product [Darwinula stevensoni]CAG0882575.1 unnamed protein product [Darwinula stevensoni]